MHHQFTGLHLGRGRAAGLKPDGVIVRGISILKTKYDTMQVITNRSGYEVNRWYDQVHRDIERMIRAWQTGYWDYALDGACTEYGGCKPDQRLQVLRPQHLAADVLSAKVWDPLAGKQLTVAEWEES